MTTEEKQEYLKVFGEYVRYLRQKKGWSQEELATKCGYTSGTRKSTIHKIEAGKSDLSASKIKTLASVLGVSPADLIDPPSEARDEMMICELFERCHGKEAFQLVQRFLQLDPEDRGRVGERIDVLLEGEKYQKEKTQSIITA